MADQVSQVPQEPPYGVISDQLRNGEVIPFLGAGASLSGRPSDYIWDAKTAKYLPSGSDLAHRLADDSSFPDQKERDNLSKVSSYYTEEVSDRPGLLSLLHRTFDRDYEIGKVHRFLAAMDIPLFIVTTNYDDLIERAFTEKRKPFHLVSYPTDHPELGASVLWWEPGATEPQHYHPTIFPLSFTDTTIIYKMHGTVDRKTKKWDSFVITEEDYVDFLARMTGQAAIPANFSVELRSRRFLFLGYGLGDWNFRVMLKNLRTILAKQKSGAQGTSTETDPEQDPTKKKLRSWAIQRDPSDLEKALWSARDVKIFEMEIDQFIEKLDEKMKS